MASNSFGSLFKITTWGESHGPAVGVVIDGCPPQIPLQAADIDAALALRAPGRRAHTSPRREPDQIEILSGVFEGQTTGAPIALCIRNRDADSSQYDALKKVWRPGHANYTYMQKYGCFDHRGGGRASARETACRVAAGAVAQQVLNQVGLRVDAYLHSVGTIACQQYPAALQVDALYANPLFCPESQTEQAMHALLQQVAGEGDSLGGVVVFYAQGLPAGLGDPVYEKLEANLAKAMLSIPASKGFDIGSGFAASQMRGSEHNDAFSSASAQATTTNHAGGTLGGISSGMPLYGRVAFKPTSSIKRAQQTTDSTGQAVTLTLPDSARHDPCVAIRAVPVVQAMCRLVLVDALLMQRSVDFAMPAAKQEGVHA